MVPPIRSSFLILSMLSVWAVAIAGGAQGTPAERPNILWLSCEDTGPHLGCYGDPDARTPNLDALAGRGLRYRRAWSTAPVCAPARTAIISGMYPSSTGSEHMRSLVPMPAGTRMFPQLLREAGYYCSNNSKEDYNLVKPGQVWDASSPRAHWRDRGPGQPFFAVFNYTETHESQIRQPGHRYVQDPARVRLPPYHPDLPEVRAGWAQYHDQVSVVDGRVGRALEELTAAGLADDTIVFFFGDHGSGMPRHKRDACDSGLRVPLIVHFPERWRHLAPPEYAAGGESRRLVGFVDLAPTVLSLAGLRAPAWVQGSAVAGPFARPGPEFLFGLRGRMDERYDLVRSVTDGRFVYVRNYLPHRPHGQHVAYQFQTPATVAWWQGFLAGGLSPAQRAFWEPRDAEELFDLDRDPYETVNLAPDPAHRRTLERLRRAHRRHTVAVGDIDLLPEAEMLRRAKAGAPGDLASGGGEQRTDVRRLLGAAELAATRGPADAAELRRLARLARDGDPGVRWWAMTGYQVRGPAAVAQGAAVLRTGLADPSPTVRVAAAEALVSGGAGEEDHRAAVRLLLRSADARIADYFDAVAALNAIDNHRSAFAGHRAALEDLPRRLPGVEPRVNEHLDRLLRHILPETQLTRGPGGRILTNTGVWSPDGRWIVYDTRSDAAGEVFDGRRIEAINVDTREIRVLYESRNGAPCGAVTFHPDRWQVAFIHGPENPTPDWSYGPFHRQGLVVDWDRPGLPVPLDARDLTPPFTPGALRGGSHVHVFSPDGRFVSFTYEDHVLAVGGGAGVSREVDINQRNIGVSVVGRPVEVSRGAHPRNHSGTAFTVLVTRTVNRPQPGSDEIQKAFEEGWVGTRGYLTTDGHRQLALTFQGQVISSAGATNAEVFVVDLPADLTAPGEAPLEGTLQRRPAPPRSVHQRRLTFTADRRFPGIQGPRHWLRASPDGSRIAFLMRDDHGVVQLWTVSPRGGEPRQVTRNDHDIASTFTWSSDGTRVAHVLDRSVCVTDLAGGLTHRLTEPTEGAEAPRMEACVFSPDGRRIAFVRRRPEADGRWYNQICVVDAD